MRAIRVPVASRGVQGVAKATSGTMLRRPINLDLSSSRCYRGVVGGRSRRRPQWANKAGEARETESGFRLDAAIRRCLEERPKARCLEDKPKGLSIGNMINPRYSYEALVSFESEKQGRYGNNNGQVYSLAQWRTQHCQSIEAT